MEARVQVAYHFKIDTAKPVEFPDMVTRTISVGEEMRTEKVSLYSVDQEDRRHLMEMMQAAHAEATRVAKPKVTEATAALEASEEEPEEEEEAF